jgi:hypothetical protein
MAFEAIPHQVDQLHNVRTRLEGLAEHHPPVTDARHNVAGNRVLSAQTSKTKGASAWSAFVFAIVTVGVTAPTQTELSEGVGELCFKAERPLFRPATL